ncbi:MAG: 50S ribosomal protein L25 [Myxococcota bacterium]
MSANSLAVEIRTDKGKGVARKLRQSGRVPAILYGHGNEPTSLALDPRVLEGILRESDAGMNTLIDLKGDPRIAGKMVMVKDLQREPVRGEVLHADLLEIDANQKVHVSVPVHVKGTPTGVSLSGGILDQVIRELELECLPGAIPEELALDVSGLDLGESLHVRDITLPAGVTLLTDGDLSVVSVAAATVTAEDLEVAEGEEAPAEGAEAPEAAPAEEPGS